MLVFNAKFHQTGAHTATDEIRMLAWLTEQLSQKYAVPTPLYAVADLTVRNRNLDSLALDLKVVIDLAGTSFFQLDTELIQLLVSSLSVLLSARPCLAP